jgi:hypothetical protein
MAATAFGGEKLHTVWGQEAEREKTIRSGLPDYWMVSCTFRTGFLPPYFIKNYLEISCLKNNICSLSYLIVID